MSASRSAPFRAPTADDCTATANDCSLRGAILRANAASGADTINFNIPGSGVKTIGVVGDATNGALPKITTTMTIDGFSQPGATAGSPLIELDGTNAGPGIPGEGGAHGLFIRDTSNVVVKGLVINRFSGNGVLISSAGIGGTGNRIEGNFIGTDPSGTQDRGNSARGVAFFGSRTTTLSEATKPPSATSSPSTTVMGWSPSGAEATASKATPSSPTAGWA